MRIGRDAGIAKILLDGGARFDRLTGSSVRHAGMGIVIDERHVLTCAHVVNAALGVPEATVAQPDAGVPIAFPLTPGAPQIHGRVVAWRPMNSGGASDIAVLELDADVPREVGRARFVRSGPTTPGSEIEVFGTRAGSDTGNWVEARFMGLTSQGEAQIDGVSNVGVFVQGGFSGAAAWDVGARRPIGMVVARDLDPLDRVAYIVPTAALEDVWPALSNRKLPGLPDVFIDLVAERTKGFGGREHVFAKVNDFIARQTCGYLTLIGDPGLGKSAVLGELTKRKSCVAHFFVRAEGITKAEQFLTYLGEQLRERYGVDTASSIDEAPGIRLKRWLSQAAEELGGEKLVVVVDALDECEETTRTDRSGNLLFLPRALPPGVIFVMSRRDLDPAHFHIKLETDPGVGNEPVTLKEFEAENRRDVERYLEHYFEGNPDHPWLRRHELSVTRGMDILSERSERNFMYLRHILPHLRDYPHEFAPANLPRGLSEYYQGHHDRMTARWRDRPEEEAVFQIVYVLAVAEKPLTRGQLQAMVARRQEFLVTKLIDQWREFLDVVTREETTYRIYHASFSEFLTRSSSGGPPDVRTRTAARSVTDWFLARFLAGRGG